MSRRRSGPICLIAALLLAVLAGATRLEAADEPPWEEWLPSYEDIRQALRHADANRFPDIGLPNLMLSFDTRACGVALSPRLRETYPEQMTIVLQYQFERLVVAEDDFAVDLRFSGRRERISVPYIALTGFYDLATRRRAGFTPTAKLCTPNG